MKLSVGRRIYLGLARSSVRTN